MKVLWTESALGQLQGIYDDLTQTSPQYALRIIDQLTSRSIQIATFPFSGRMVPEYELTEVREVIAYRQRTLPGFYSDLRPKESHAENKCVNGDVRYASACRNVV